MVESFSMNNSIQYHDLGFLPKLHLGFHLTGEREREREASPTRDREERGEREREKKLGKFEL